MLSASASVLWLGWGGGGRTFLSNASRGTGQSGDRWYGAVSTASARRGALPGRPPPPRRPAALPMLSAPSCGGPTGPPGTTPSPPVLLLRTPAKALGSGSAGGTDAQSPRALPRRPSGEASWDPGASRCGRDTVRGTPPCTFLSSVTCSSAGGTLPSPLSRRAMASLDCDRSVDADQLAVCGSAVLRHEYTFRIGCCSIVDSGAAGVRL
mmetsp:Transcript_7163/g.21040  ORF Transcript_7163/g.21040 Transcript_7163/m.21040 type:complete len:209 (+) Transcript_7163:1275-1901(+)